MKKSLFYFILVLAIVIPTFSASEISALECTGNNHLLSIQVFSEADPVNDAQVRFYYDPQRERMADNLLTPWIEDADVTTDAGGNASLALAEDTYYVRIIANNHFILETTTIMPTDGTCGTATYFLTPTISSSEFDPARTQVTVAPSSIPADGKTTSTLTLQTFNRYGSVVPNLSVDLDFTLNGLQVTHLATSTNRVGKASFAITGTVHGQAILRVKIENQIIRTATLTLTDPTATTTRVAPITFSSTRSKAFVSGSPANPDGTTAITLNVFVKDSDDAPIVGSVVNLRSALPNLVVSPNYALTDADGYALLNLTSSTGSSGLLTIMADGQALNDRPRITFRQSEIKDGSAVEKLIKLKDDGDPDTQADTTVYYVGRDGMRHPFMYERIFFSWYANYENIQIVSPEQLTGYALGKPVPYRPGSRLIKFTSVPKVYAVEKPNVLRWVTTPQLAADLYGANWTQQIDDVQESLFYLYSWGADITQIADYNSTEQTMSALSVDDVL
ncbi:MAG: Ig-like domain-containing protein [Patescibacteria group bacterium]|nr:Ig-like domain-containing protein [Patescibacteria group bacterium]MBU2508820.1 Ig-like domain-containing protein [Patescibacteria group bacterium]